jgi:hypothetical protein
MNQRKNQETFRNQLIIMKNDHKQRIRHYLAGFPGTSHDIRIWEATDLFMNPDFYFAVGQYLLGDSAYSNGHTMVASYKKNLLVKLCLTVMKGSTLKLQKRELARNTQLVCSRAASPG